MEIVPNKALSPSLSLSLSLTLSGVTSRSYGRDRRVVTRAVTVTVTVTTASVRAQSSCKGAFEDSSTPPGQAAAGAGRRRQVKEEAHKDGERISVAKAASSCFAVRIDTVAHGVERDVVSRRKTRPAHDVIEGAARR